MRAHSIGCQLRWVCATLVLLPIPVVLYQLLQGQVPPALVGEGIEGYVVAALGGLGCSFVAVWVLARLPYLVLAVVATTVAGLIISFALGVIVLGPEGEAETEGTVYVVAAIAGAFDGLFLAVAAWSLLRLAHRFLSRGTCPPT